MRWGFIYSVWAWDLGLLRWEMEVEVGDEVVREVGEVEGECEEVLVVEEAEVAEGELETKVSVENLKDVSVHCIFK